MIPTEVGWYWVTAYRRRRPVWVYRENGNLFCRAESFCDRLVISRCFRDWSGPIIEDCCTAYRKNIVLDAKIARYEAVLKYIRDGHEALPRESSAKVLTEFGN